MRLLFENPPLVDYLTAQRVNRSIYEYVAYDSEVEREFAKQLDVREGIKLFVKLPAWFKIDTPVGTYNPDWAIVKEDQTLVYLVRETKATKAFLQLRTSEADKVRCGKKTLRCDRRRLRCRHVSGRSVKTRGRVTQWRG